MSTTPNPLAGSPVQPLPDDNRNPFDLASIVQQVASLPEYQGPVKQLSDVYGKESDIASQQADLAAHPPQVRWQPHYEPVTGAGSLLRDVGKGLLQGLSLTGPGQGIQDALYKPGVENWERRKEALANQMATLKGQQEVPAEELRGLTGLTQAGGMAAYRGGELDIQRQRVQAYNQKVQNSLAMGMRSLDIRQLMAGSTMELNKAKVLLDNVLAQTAPERIALGYYGVDANNATRQSVANTLAQLGMDKSHPVAQMLDSLLGTSLTPAAPQVPTGAQPVSGEKPMPQRGKPTATAKPGGGVIYARDSQGKLHQAPAGTALPKGWKMERR